MSVKIARLRGGEDIIADIYEVAEEESKEPVAYKMVKPYCIFITSDSIKVEVDGGEDYPRKINDVQLHIIPWAPLSAESDLYVNLSEVVTIYEPNSQAKQKYQELISAQEDDFGFEVDNDAPTAQEQEIEIIEDSLDD